MNTRAQIVRLVNNPETSRTIGWLASQQRLAYNHAVEELNRRPDMPKRAKRGSAHGLNKLLTAWRQANPEAATAPYHIHQQGSEAAWDANQRLQDSREQRLARVEKAHAKGEEPHPRDLREHRRTLRYRSRKHGSQTLTIRSTQFVKVQDDHSFRLVGVDFVFRTKRPLPSNIRSLHFVETAKHRRAANAPLHARRYKLAITVGHHDPDLPDLADAPLSAYEGIDDGIKNNLTFSDDDRFNFRESYPTRDARAERRVAQRKMQGSKRGKRHAATCTRKTRRRNAERRRQANHHVGQHLDRNQPVAICVENKSVAKLMRSGHGKGRAQKTGLNRSLAAAGLSGLALVVANQAAKRGIHLIFVPPQGSSQTCPRCGYRHRKNRKTQASFQCLRCNWTGHADHSASIILRNRGFVRTTERIHKYTPVTEVAPTGWREQSSRGGQHTLLPPSENTSQPDRDATRPASRRPGSVTPGRTAQVRDRQATMTPVMGPAPETGSPKVYKVRTCIVGQHP